MRSIIDHASAVLGLVFVFGTACQAQNLTESGVRAAGVVVIERPAQRMRMQIDVMAKAKNLKEAVASLKERQSKAARELVELGATKDSIKFSDPKVDVQQNDQQRHIAMMIRQRMTPNGRNRRTTNQDDEEQPIKLT